MIRVSANVHGASTPFKRGPVGFAPIKANGNSNRKYRKQTPATTVYKCNGQIDVQSSSPIRSNQSKSLYTSNAKSNSRPSPFQEMQSSNISKLSDNSESDSETNLFAGSKACVTPSPSSLPSPPQSWITGVKLAPNNFQYHDTAILVIGNEKIIHWSGIIIFIVQIIEIVIFYVGPFSKKLFLCLSFCKSSFHLVYIFLKNITLKNLPPSFKMHKTLKITPHTTMNLSVKSFYPLSFFL